MGRGRGAAIGVAACLVSCTTPRIGDPDAYRSVALNRVFPYPTETELRSQRREIVLASRYAEHLSESAAGPALGVALQRLERYLGEAGAAVVDRGIHDLAPVRDELAVAEQRDETQEFEGADWALVSRLSRFRHWTEYAPPSSLFKDAEELAGEPGTCTHRGEIELEVKAFEVPTDDIPRATFTIAHSDEFEEERHDTRCPISRTRRQVFLEKILEAALPCLEVPIKNHFSPYGYVEEHRVRADANIFRTSLGERSGAEPGMKLTIERAQWVTQGNGAEVRENRPIGEATVTDRLGEHYSWVSVDVARLEEPVLAGDRVQAVFRPSLADRLGFGRCRKILEVQSAP